MVTTKYVLFELLAGTFQNCNWGLIAPVPGDYRDVVLISGEVGGMPAFGDPAEGFPFKDGVHGEITEYVEGCGYECRKVDGHVVITKKLKGGVRGRDFEENIQGPEYDGAEEG